MEVTVLNRQRAHRVDRRELGDFVRALAGAAPADGVETLAVCLVSDRKMRALNQKYRGHDSSTDVLSFPTGATLNIEEAKHLGDIVISVATAVRQAADASHSLTRELKILALHGYLHLLGYDHEDDDGTMLRLQSRLSRRLLSRGATGNPS